MNWIGKTTENWRRKLGSISVHRSLLLKLIIAFWLVSLLGIVSVALVAGRVSQTEFVRFINENRYQGLLNNLSSYYTLHGSFQGAEPLLQRAAQTGSGATREFVVLDKNGNVLVKLASNLPPGIPSPDFIRFGFSIDSGGKVIAYLVPLRSPHSPAESAAANLERINLTLLIGVIFATLIALISAWLIAHNILRPLEDLNSATQSIAAGDLDHQVRIQTRDEIGRLALSFNYMVNSLKRSRDLRRQMTADIAHELRNPLSIILGNAEALSEGVLPVTTEALDIIYDEAKHLQRLVDDLRTLSLTEAGELTLQLSPAEPRKILETCAAAFSIRAAEKGTRIELDAAPDLPEIEVDLERILQVLANLVDNSLKHSPAGGRIVLSAALRSPALAESAAQKAGDDLSQPAAGNPAEEVCFSVADDGEGISPEDLPFVFERFYRGKQSAARIKDGSGLGLAISRALVELHGGRISVISAAGNGTKFSFCLPVGLLS